MPDKLTAEERAAIAAFPHERIYRCARGESGMSVNGIPPRERQRIAVHQAHRRKRFDKSRAMDDLIRKYWEEGLTDGEISEKVQLNPKAIYMRRYRMSLVVEKS